MSFGLLLITLITGYYTVKSAVKNGIKETLSEIDRAQETHEISDVLAHSVGKECCIYTCANLSIFMNKLWKVECEVLEVDANWVRVRYLENEKSIEAMIRVKDIISVNHIK